MNEAGEVFVTLFMFTMVGLFSGFVLRQVPLVIAINNSIGLTSDEFLVSFVMLGLFFGLIYSAVKR